MNFIKKLAQALWKIIVAIYRAIVKLVQWWTNKIKTSGSKKGAAVWLIGGLLSVCCLCSLLYSMTPSAKESVAESRVTRTAVAIAEATAEMATRNAPTNTPPPSATLEPTNTPRSTDTPVPTQEPSKTPVKPSPTQEPSKTPVKPSPTQEPSKTPVKPTPTQEPSKTPVRPSSTPTEIVVPEIPESPLVIISASQVNVRSGPGTDYPIVQALEQGATTPAMGLNSERSWVQIELPNGTSGWVGTDLVEIQFPERINTVTEVPTLPAETTSEQQLPAQEEDSAVSSGNTVNPFQCAGGCAEPPDASCAIKGNVNSSGERIYHVPGGSFYNRTNIKPEEGDRWFCTTAEAQEAGFRASQR